MKYIWYSHQKSKYPLFITLYINIFVKKMRDMFSTEYIGVEILMSEILKKS